MWLNKSRVTLNQYGVHADAKLQFTPMHKTMRVQLPDLQLINLKIDFSVNVFNAVIQLCKEMGKCHLVTTNYRVYHHGPILNILYLSLRKVYLHRQ